MPIHFASSHSIDFYKLAGTVNTTVPGVFDANYVKQVLDCPANTPCWRQTIPSAVQADFYWQAKVYLQNTNSVAPLVSFSSTVASVMTERFRLTYPGGLLRLQYNNGGVWTTIGSTLAISGVALYTLTCRFKHHATAGELSFWVNNALIGQVTGNTAPYNSAAFVSDVDLANPSAGSGGTGFCYFAEFLVTTNENPYAMKVKTHVLTGAGTTSGWTGAYTDVDEPDPSTTDILSAASAGLVSTFATDDLPAIGADVVRAVQVSVMARRGATGPQSIQTALRASGVDQLGATQTLNTGYNTYRQIYEQNSVTGVEFTKAEIDASEVGVKSIA